MPIVVPAVVRCEYCDAQAPAEMLVYGTAALEVNCPEGWTLSHELAGTSFSRFEKNLTECPACSEQRRQAGE